MPAVVAGAALSAITVSSVGGALAIGFSLSSFAGSLILGGLSYALTPKPKKPTLDNAGAVSSSTVAVRQSDLTRQKVYGHTRVVRGYAHMESTGVNGILNMILILCDGPIRAVNEIWINDYCIPADWIDAEGGVTQGRYAGWIRIKIHLGEANQAADPLAVEQMPGTWTTDHRLQGMAYLYIMMFKNQDIYPTGVPNVSAVVEGQEVFDPRTGANTWSTNIALFARDYLTNDEYGFAALDDDIDDTNISAQANICDEIVNTEAMDATLTGVSSSILTLSGDLLNLQYGDRVEVIAPGTPPSGLSTGVSYYVIPYQVLTTPRIRLATSLANAMAKNFITVSSVGTGTVTIRKTGEPRYHGSGIIDTEVNLSENLNNIVNSMAGRAVNIGGYWTLLAGAWRAPFIDLGLGDIRGSGLGFKNGLSMAESFNIVKGKYISPLNFYQDSDYPAALYQSFIDDDAGVEYPKEINLPFSSRPTTAQRIAKIELFRGRQGIVVTADWSTKALQIQPGDNVTLTIPHLGWDEKPFEVTQFSFNSSNGALVVRLVLRETAEAIFDWTSGEAIEFDPAPNTNLPNPYLVFAPTGVSYNSRFIDTRDGDAVYTLTLNWDQHPDAFVREFGDFEVQYKLSSEDEYRPSFFVDGELTSTDVVNSSVNIAYDLRIRARNNLGVRSGWQTILGAVVGSSGGVGATEDYLLVTGGVTTSLDYGSVADAPTAFEDWDFVV